MKRLKWFSLFVVAGVAALALAHTDTTQISRLKINYPNLGYDGGASLHANQSGMITKIANSINSRYEEFTGVANSTTVNHDHNFGVAFSELTVLLYSGTGTDLTRIDNPTASGWTIAANGTTPKGIIDITTPASGSPHTFTVVVIHGSAVESIDDLDDVDTTTTVPEEGQALVWNGIDNFVPGASGDSSFKVQSVEAGGAITIKGGYQFISGSVGKMVLSTYDGAGSTSSDFGKDISFDLDSLVTAVNDTTYWLYIDLFKLATDPTQLTDTGEFYYPITATQFVLKTDDFENVESNRYVSIGVVRYGTGQWNTTVARTAPQKRFEGGLSATSNVEYELPLSDIKNVGNSGQLKAGHILEQDSFPVSSDVSFYNLTSVNDGNTTNAHNLTNSNVTFSLNGILGNTLSAASFNGSSAYLYSEDVHFLTNGDHSFGLWFWANSIASDSTLIGNFQTTSNNRSWRIYFAAGGGLKIQTDTSGDGLGLATTDIETITAGKWYHLSAVYDSTAQQYEVYLDNELKTIHSVGGALYASGTRLDIGATDSSGTATDFFTGAIDELYFANNSIFTDDQLSKVYATKITHNRTIDPIAQNWLTTIKADGQQLDSENYIVDKALNALYADFSLLPATAQVALKLDVKGFSGRTTAIKGREITATATDLDSILPINHRIGSLPVLALLVDDGTGKYEQHDASAYFKTNSTQIVTSGTTLTSILGASTKVILRWSGGGQAVVAQYRIWETFVSSSNEILTNNDRLFANPTGQQIITLPSNPFIGYTVDVIDYDGTFSVTDYVEIVPSGTDTIMGYPSLILNVPNDKVTLVFNGSNWRIK